MPSRKADGAQSVLWRIGEVAKLTGVTTRTLRYWEEVELIRPSTHRVSGERLYSPSDVARVARISNLQELLGFSLAEVRAVLDTEDIDVLDRVRSELKAGGISRSRRRALLEEAIVANDQLLARLDDTLSRIGAFRDERVEVAKRLRASRDELEEEATSRVISRAESAARKAPPS
jgi:DNA-binding transcriptional MerR regulator